MTTFAGIGPLVTALAFISLPIFGARLGVLPAIVGTIAMLLHLVLAVLLSRVVVGAASSAMKSTVGMEFAALQYALVISLSMVGWVIPAALAQDGRLLDDPRAFIKHDLPSGTSFIVRSLPTGWGSETILAASESRWLVALAQLGGLIAIIAVLAVIWVIQLDRRLSSRTTRLSGGILIPQWTKKLLPSTPLGGDIGRELRTWYREPRMALEARIAILSGLFIVVIPASVNWTEIVPWVGVIIAILGAACSCNLYGLEGSAFWTTLMTPGACSVDARGKQWAFLFVFGPIAIILTAIATISGEQWWAWPWVLAILPATLGAGAGVMILVSARSAIPVPVAARRSGNFVAAAENTGQTFITIILVIATILPTVAIVAVGGWIGSAPLQWAGIPAGLATGILSAWGGGWLAIRHLDENGPELLSLLRYGRRV